jgi:group I intron endonuclease
METKIKNHYNCIYKLTGPENKIYIGQANNFNRRMNSYKRLKCQSQTKLYNTIKKYGWENFKSEVLIDNLAGKVEMNEKEIFYVKAFDSFVRKNKNGLNLTEGGDGQMGMVLSEESRKKISDKLKGKLLSEETRRKMSVSKKGKRNMSDEHYRKMSIRMTGTKQSSETLAKLSVIRKGKSYPHTPESKLKLSLAHKGKILTEDHRRKLSESHKKPVPQRRIQRLFTNKITDETFIGTSQDFSEKFKLYDWRIHTGKHKTWKSEKVMPSILRTPGDGLQFDLNLLPVYHIFSENQEENAQRQKNFACTFVPAFAGPPGLIDAGSDFFPSFFYFLGRLPALSRNTAMHN